MSVKRGVLGPLTLCMCRVGKHIPDCVQVHAAELTFCGGKINKLHELAINSDECTHELEPEPSEPVEHPPLAWRVRLQRTCFRVHLYDVRPKQAGQAHFHK